MSEYLFGKGFGNEPNLLPVATLSELRSSSPIRLHDLDSVDGNVTLEELAVLASAVVRHKPERLFEIGTFDGRTTLNLATNTGPDARIWTLDLPQSDLRDARFPIESGEARYIVKPMSGARFVNAPEAAKITQLYGDSAAFDYGPYIGEMDFVFVDASHAYDYVMNDSVKALAMIGHRNGVIFWHDYSVWDGVTRALNELHRRDPAFAGLRWIEGTSLAVMTVHQ